MIKLYKTYSFRYILYRLAFVVLFGSSCFLARGQQYNMLPDSNSSWGNACGGSYPLEICYGYSSITNEDTIINSKNYNKLYAGLSSYMGAYRNDTLSGEVWFISKDSTDEVLFIDFSLSVGDTSDIPQLHYTGGQYGPIVVDLVDTIFYAQKDRRAIHFHSVKDIFDNGTFVEGVGNYGGFFSFYNSRFEWSCYMWCFIEYDTLRIGDEVSCHTTLTYQEEIETEENEIVIYPNPASDYIVVQSSLMGTYSLINNMGELVANGEYNERLSLGKYANGIYLIRLHDGTSKKIIISNRL